MTVNDVNVQKHNLRANQAGSSLDFWCSAYDVPMTEKCRCTAVAF